MRILGIDPGFARLGYAVVEDEPGLRSVTYGCLTTSTTETQARRLLSIYQELGEVVRQHQPDVMAVERLYFNRNVNTALTVGEARGVVLLCAAQAGCPVEEYSPPEVKQALVGYGRAEKRQIQEMVRMVLSLAEAPQPDDAADAAAVAICHAQMRHARALLAGG